MLVMSRKLAESVNIGGDLLITVIEIRGDKVRLGVAAPPAFRRPEGGPIHAVNEPQGTECVNIGSDILITVIEIRGDKVRLGVVAPKDASIHRQEVWEALHGPASRAVIDPAWLTWNDGTVLRLARAIADERNYGALPILADALEEAGCTDDAILGHCRTCGPDVRNSWVVRFILSASRGATAYTVTLSTLL